MTQAGAPIRHADRFFIGGQWVAPSSDATISVIDSDTEQLYFTVPEAQGLDIDWARHRRPGSVRHPPVDGADARAAGRVPAGHRGRTGQPRR